MKYTIEALFLLLILHLQCLFFQILPPPNVTGVLHIGHAITVAIEVFID